MKKIMVAIIIRFSYENLRNEAHVEFHTTVNALFLKFDPGTLGLGTLYVVYQPLLAQEIAALDIIRRSGFTPEIAEEDHNRDSLYRGFADSVKSSLHHYDPVKQAAAKKVEVILDHYGNIAAKSLDEETAAIEDLYRELLRQENSPSLIALGLGEWLDKLVQANRRMEKLMMERYDEAAKRPNVHMQSIRKEVDKVFRSILDLLEALVRVKGTGTNREFISELNVVMERYRDILAQEAGRRHPVKDLADGDHCVVEPIGVQKYTEKAVTPIPKAHYREEGKPTVELTFAKDFSVTYKNNVNVGMAELTLHGKGNYKGQKTVTFNIAR
jgi:phosphate uptake regulator